MATSEHTPDDGAARRPPPSTRHLARQATAHRAEFARLYERVAPAVYAWARLRIRPEQRRHLDPDDVVQEVWCRAVTRFDTFDAEATPFRAWIFRVAKYVLLEAFRALRKTSALGAAPDGEGTRSPDTFPDEATSLTQRVARNEELRAFLAYVETLDDQERDLVIHCGLEGLGYDEVATRLGLTRDAAKKRWQRLRARLVEHGIPRDVLEAA